MSVTWCRIGASLCLIGVSAWGINEWASGGPPRPAPIEVVGPAAAPEETAAVVRWALERAGLTDREPRAVERPAPERAAVWVGRASAPRAMSSRAIPVPGNAVKGGGKVSYVGRRATGGSTSAGRHATRDFTRALGRSHQQRASNWVPRFSGRRR